MRAGIVPPDPAAPGPGLDTSRQRGDTEPHMGELKQVCRTALPPTVVRDD
jgi:hypothetical protein